jgi:uncharacterized SAM-binding protein YcdF (DUF218 family)
MQFLWGLIEFILLPSNLIAVIGVLGVLALILRRRRLGTGLVVLSVLLLAIVGWLPVGSAALTVLENRFPPPDVSGPIAGIVVLGGGVDTHIAADRGQSTLNEAAERITAAGELSRVYPEARLLLSGGAGHLGSGQGVTESGVARDVLIGLGVDPRRMILEESSEDTCRNAEESLLAATPSTGERWLLITSAGHMPRAVACFRAVAFPVIPYPVDYRTRGPGNLSRQSPIAEGLRLADLAAHEWLGLLGYRLLGRTSEFFPAPGGRPP